MDILYSSCAGLDVHKETVVACVRRFDAKGKVQAQTRTFGTMTSQLLELGDWLAEHEVTQLAMESTGVYWKPIWNLLEDQFHILLVNAQHIKQVPGRKTDVKDAEWIAQLLQHGLHNTGAAHFHGFRVPRGGMTTDTFVLAAVANSRGRTSLLRPRRLSSVFGEHRGCP